MAKRLVSQLIGHNDRLGMVVSTMLTIPHMKLSLSTRLNRMRGSLLEKWHFTDAAGHGMLDPSFSLETTLFTVVQLIDEFTG